jgi:hypothetical protein
MKKLWDKIKAGGYHLHFLVSASLSILFNLVPFVAVLVGTHIITYMAGGYILFNLVCYKKEKMDKRFSWMDMLANNIGWIFGLILVLVIKLWLK